MGAIALPDGSLVLLDTVCVIYAVEQVAPYEALVAPILKGIDGGRITCTLSTLVIAEVLTKPLRDGDTDLAAILSR